MFLGLSARAAAHDSPEHVIEHLNAAMAREGRSAKLLYRRACEYRALNKPREAIADLEHALTLDAAYLSALAELSRLELASGQAEKALQTVSRGIERCKVKSERAPLYVIRCDVWLALKQPEQALADCERACAERPGEVDWRLKHSEVLARLGRHAERVTALRAAFERTQSAVLKIEWVEAMIDAGQVQPALVQIEAELADSRWQSSWLLRRARARKALGHDSAAAGDLQAAIAEINQRINPARPDGSLLSDRALAYALLGDMTAARADLEAARKTSSDLWGLRRVEELLAASAAAR